FNTIQVKKIHFVARTCQSKRVTNETIILECQPSCNQRGIKILGIALGMIGKDSHHLIESESLWRPLLLLFLLLLLLLLPLLLALFFVSFLFFSLVSLLHSFLYFLLYSF